MADEAEHHNTFDCESCGASLTFAAGTERLECEYCGEEVFLLGGIGISFEIDHVKTMSKGGHNTRENLKISCPIPCRRRM